MQNFVGKVVGKEPKAHRSSSVLLQGHTTKVSHASFLLFVSSLKPIKFINNICFDLKCSYTIHGKVIHNHYVSKLINQSSLFSVHQLLFVVYN